MAPNGRDSSVMPVVSDLVSNTVGFAWGYTDDIESCEHWLEAQLKKDESLPLPSQKVDRIRHRGALLLHSKQVLLVVVVLNLIDCALVLGELILDIHYLKVVTQDKDLLSQTFIDNMELRYPQHIFNNSVHNMDRFYDQIYSGECSWIDATTPHSVTNSSQTWSHSPTSSLHAGSIIDHIRRRSVPNPPLPRNNTNSTGRGSRRRDVHHESHIEDYNIEEDIAHALHKASITILGILFLENVLKVIFMGRHLLGMKLEVFDAVVVMLSFIVDIVFLKGLTSFTVQDAVFILSFLLPWRVIRVLNSLVVAVLGHAHFRMKLLYKEKKCIASDLELMREKDKRIESQIRKIEEFCIAEGIPKWKIRQHTAMTRKLSSVTSMASLALGGLVNGFLNQARQERKSMTSSSSGVSSITIGVPGSNTGDQGINRSSSAGSFTNVTFDVLAVIGEDEVFNK